MNSYYYLLSGLPMLKSDGEMPITYADFLEACKGCVSNSKFEILSKLTLDSTDGPLISLWAEFYSAFKRELTFQRNQRLGRPTGDVFPRDLASAAAVGSALADKNPLEAEKALLAFLFEKLDSLIGIHSFDDFALMGYALKLKLLERKTVFKKEDGKNELNRLVSGLKEQISGI